MNWLRKLFSLALGLTILNFATPCAQAQPRLLQDCWEYLTLKPSSTSELFRDLPEYAKYQDTFQKFKWKASRDEFIGHLAQSGARVRFEVIRPSTAVQFRFGGGLDLLIWIPTEKRESILKVLEGYFGDQLEAPERVQQLLEVSPYVARILNVSKAGRKKNIEILDNIMELDEEVRLPRTTEFIIKPELTEFTNRRVGTMTEEIGKAVTNAPANLDPIAKMLAGTLPLKAREAQRLSPLERQQIFDNYFELINYVESHL